MGREELETGRAGGQEDRRAKATATKRRSDASARLVARARHVSQVDGKRETDGKERNGEERKRGEKP